MPLYYSWNYIVQPLWTTITKTREYILNKLQNIVQNIVPRIDHQMVNGANSPLFSTPTICLEIERERDHTTYYVRDQTISFEKTKISHPVIGTCVLGW